MLVRIFLTALLPLSGQRFQAFWADAFHDGYKNPQQVERMVDDVAAANGNAIFIEMRHRGGSYYLRTLEPPAEDPTYSKGFDALEALISKAHARGIQVHGWAPVYPLWPFTRPPADPNHAWNRHGPSAEGAEMWMTVASNGQIGTSLDPGHPAVSRYLADVLVEPLKHYELDGLHLDYIRYPEDAAYGYNPIAVERFRRLALPPGGPPRGDAWNGFRRRQVTDFVRQVYLRAAAIRPSAVVSAALISWGNGPLNAAGFRSTDAYGRVFQDWRAWMEEGILDVGMPMFYFRESTAASFLDRWLAFQRDHTYGRAMMPGLGAYLNPIAASLAQTNRVLAASPAGIAFYSYAVTNVEGPGGRPLEPNSGFYTRIGELLGPRLPPALPWKTAPVTGHLSGRLHVDGPAWLVDGATVQVENDLAALDETPRTITADGTGFFGIAGLPPGRYRVRVLRNGEIFRSAAQDVAPGRVTHFEVSLSVTDFTSVLPALEPPAEAAPGEVIRLRGRNLSEANATAAAVPLPETLGGTQVLVNGVPAPLFSVSAGEVAIQLPFAGPFEVQLRHSGLESNTVAVAAVPAHPKILGVHRRGDGYLEIFAEGLGAVEPAIAPGAGAEPPALPRTAQPVAVRWTDSGRTWETEPVFSGLAPWIPGRYQVNAVIPGDGNPTSLQLVVGGRVSEAARISGEPN